MAAITTLLSLPDQPGVFTAANLAAIIAALTAQNTNNTNLNAGLATLTAQTAILGAAGVYHATYNFAVDGGGAPGLITPAVNATIPANFVIQNVALNPTTAILATGGAATVSVGLSAGAAGAAALIAATAKASWSINALLQGIPVPQDVTKWIKMSAPGTITLTSATNALTAGIVEIYCFGYQSAS